MRASCPPSLKPPHAPSTRHYALAVNPPANIPPGAPRHTTSLRRAALLPRRRAVQLGEGEGAGRGRCEGSFSRRASGHGVLARPGDMPQVKNARMIACSM